MSAYTEQQVEFNSEVLLKGTLTIPDQPQAKFPAVLIIGGTGDNDRDGYNQTKKMDLTAYRELAHYLGEQGYMALRYDKRGCGASEGDYYETGFWDLVDDAIAAVRFLREHDQVDSVILLGHSEGAMIAPAVVEKEALDGMILLSGVAEASNVAFGRQTEELFAYLAELKGFKGFLIRLFKIQEKAKKQNEATIQRILSSPTPVIKIKGQKINAKWFQEQFQFNVLDYLPKVTCPVLAITGTKDMQVVPEHAQVLAERVSGPSEWHLIPNLTHVLRKTDAQLTPLTLIKEYKKQIQHPIDSELKEKISAWMSRYFQR
ncbi:alpha/beta hydrolase [Brevibacillus ginsengisoli]|uniref:alpha/beta hydrolase n=1 Tax=Brevibacillus ginsengisoli TaxID=363854 RepID=UPI003CF67A7E